jgi:hypothetical protein
VIDLLMFAMVGGLTGWLVRCRQRRRAVNFAVGGQVKVPCSIKTLSQRGFRWKHGHALIGEGSVTWEASVGRNDTVVLFADHSQARVRKPSVREMWWVNPNCKILTCGTRTGPVLVAVLANELDLVLTALNAGSRGSAAGSN